LSSTYKNINLIVVGSGLRPNQIMNR